MDTNTRIISALPLIASALGRKYGVKVRIGGERAYTNGKDIHLPALPLDSDEEVLHLARGYIDHESAHLRLTDFEALKNTRLSGMEKHVWNILEDYMVERKLGEIYPGCQENFNWLIRRLFLREGDASDPSGDSPAAVFFNWLLISLRAISVPELEAEQQRLAGTLDDAYPGLRQKLQPLVQDMPAFCQNTSGCIATAKRIVRMLENYAAEHDAKHGKAESAETAKDDKSQTGSHSAPSVNNETKEDEGQKSQALQRAVRDKHGETAGTSSQTNTQAVKNREESKTAQELRKVLDDPAILQGTDIGEEAGKLLEGLCQGSDRNQLAIAEERPFQGKDLGREELCEIRQSCVGLRTRLTALLQSHVIVRSAPAYAGRIDPGKLGRLSVGNGRIFIRKSTRQGYSTAIHILLDVSASMNSGNKIALACQACYALASTLQNFHGVGMAVTSFPNGYSLNAEADQLNWSTVASVLTHRQKMHPRFKISCNGSTPMAEAIWWALQKLAPLPENRKLLVIISDGEPDNSNEAANALQGCLTHGIEAYGIGIRTQAMNRLLTDGKACAVYDMNELAPLMFEMMRATLLKPQN